MKAMNVTIGQDDTECVPYITQFPNGRLLESVVSSYNLSKRIAALKLLFSLIC